MHVSSNRVIHSPIVVPVKPFTNDNPCYADQLLYIMHRGSSVGKGEVYDADGRKCQRLLTGEGRARRSAPLRV